MEFHGTKLPKKEESVIFCVRPLRRQRTLGAPGGTGDVGGLAAPWHCELRLGMIGVGISLAELAALAELERYGNLSGHAYAQACNMYTAQDFTIHIGSESRVSKMDTVKLSDMAQRGSGILRHPDSQLSWKPPAC